MKIVEYIHANWDKLPKSTFNGDEVVIFRCDADEDYGYGHHQYSGYGGDINGGLVMCYSSGCSCDGSCGVDHIADYKTLTVKGEGAVDDVDPATINFGNLQVQFNDY